MFQGNTIHGKFPFARNFTCFDQTHLSMEDKKCCRCIFFEWHRSKTPYQPTIGPSGIKVQTPKSRTSSPSPSNPLVPLHQSITGSTHLSGMSGGSKIHSFTTPSKSPASPSMYLVPSASMRSPVQQTHSSCFFSRQKCIQ
ncbi:hypothetical protein ACP275_03G070400 [Erythranthe tilingii]